MSKFEHYSIEEVDQTLGIIFTPDEKNPEVSVLLFEAWNYPELLEHLEKICFELNRAYNLGKESK